MAQLLVRDIPNEVVADLKWLAQQHHRSLQKEAQAILEEAARRARGMNTAYSEALALRQVLGNEPHPDSTDWIRADRER